MPMNKALRVEWDRAGYGSRMGSAEVVPPPPKEFIRLYHLTSADFAISNIALGRLKVARFSDANDPFELIALNLRERRDRNVLRDFKDAYDSHTGLLCFSANWVNPVLWSHYGAKHRGICLGFDLKRSRAQRVRYKDKRLLSELNNKGDPLSLDAKLQEALLCTKFGHWQYEEEYRVFVKLEDAIQEGRLHFCHFDDDLRLVEVILGPQCNLSLDAVRHLTQTSSKRKDGAIRRARPVSCR
jgi:hypothetical protein